MESKPRQDTRTSCIGDKWKVNPDKIPEPVVLETKEDVQKRNATIGATIGGIALLLLLL